MSKLGSRLGERCKHHSERSWVLSYFKDKVSAQRHHAYPLSRSPNARLSHGAKTCLLKLSLMFRALCYGCASRNWHPCAQQVRTTFRGAALEPTQNSMSVNLAFIELQSSLPTTLPSLELVSVATTIASWSAHSCTLISWLSSKYV